MHIISSIIFIKNHQKLLLFTLLLLFSLYSAFLIVSVSMHANSDKSLVLLASQFLKGKIALLPNAELPLGDISDYKSNYYLYFGPFSSIILMPFVFLFGKSTPQILIGIISMSFSFLAIFSLSRRFRFSTNDALWLSLFFVFSTVLFSSSLIDISAYQVEALGVPCVLLSLNEYFGKRRPLITGLFLGLAVLTRFTLMLSFIFFVVEFIRRRVSARQLMTIFIPVFITCILLGLYNDRRFHSFFETGYNYNITLKTFPLSLNLKHGSVSLTHLPANLYSLFIMSPQPLLENKSGFVLKFPYLKASPWGMAIWYTSPLFLVLLYKFKKSEYTISALITSIVLSLPVLFYYSIGFAQFGYRYVLDFLPFLFVLLLPSLSPKLQRKDFFLIVVGVIFNCIFITSLWEVYPLLGIYH